VGGQARCRSGSHCCISVDVQWFADQGLAGAEGQQLAGQQAPRSVAACAASSSSAARIVTADAQGQQVQCVADGGQQVVELVRQAAAEPADRLELLGVAQRTLGIAQQSLCLPLLGDVAGDLDEAEQFAASTTGSMTTLARNEEPSRRTRQPSLATWPCCAARRSRRCGSPASRSVCR
jgi:hypothetical protein